MKTEPAILTRGLGKVYRVAKKEPGLGGAIRGLFHRRYDDLVAVGSVDLEIAPGELVGFLGPNGAGKTTTLKMLSGLLHPTCGTARVLGHVPWERTTDFRRQISLLLGQKNQLLWDLPARESFELNRAIYGIAVEEGRETIDHIAGVLEVSSLLNKPVRELSLGERMKMELIAALLHRPKVLFLDEPTLGLDVVSQHRVRDFLRHLVEEEKITTILTSHYLQDIEALCRRVIIIDHGKVIHDGSWENPAELFRPEGDCAEICRSSSRTRGGGVGGAGFADEATVRLRVPPARVTEISRRALELPGLEDIRIETMPVEEVIRRVFTGTKGKEKN